MVAVLLLIPTLIDSGDGAGGGDARPRDAQSPDWLLERFPELTDESSALRQQIADLGAALQARAGRARLNTVLTSVVGVLNWLLIIVVVPVVTFYLLLDWDAMVERIDDLLPREHAPTIRALMRESDDRLAAFIRGQGLVCLILGTYYAVALIAVGLNFGLVVGAVAGALTFIPYVGALVGGVLAIGLALFQFWGDWVWVVAVWAIFQSGQFVEGNFLTPKLVGERVGVHPVWLHLRAGGLRGAVRLRGRAGGGAGGGGDRRARAVRHRQVQAEPPLPGQSRHAPSHERRAAELPGRRRLARETPPRAPHHRAGAGRRAAELRLGAARGAGARGLLRLGLQRRRPCHDRRGPALARGQAGAGGARGVRARRIWCGSGRGYGAPSGGRRGTSGRTCPRRGRPWPWRTWRRCRARPRRRCSISTTT